MLMILPAIAILLLPLLALRKPLAAQIALACLSWLIFAATSWLTVMGWGTGILPGLGNSALHDTYYVVSHTSYVLSLALGAGLLASGAWAARLSGRTATVAFWALHIACAATVVPQFTYTTAKPGFHGDYLELARRLETLNTISTWASLMALLAFIVLAGLIMSRLLGRILARR